MTNVEVRVRSSYSALSPTCQKAADYLLAHTRELYSIPIAELARQSGVSSAAWVRLCKEIGYTGLKDMRQQLYLQYSAEPQVEVDPTVHFSDLREGKSAQEILQNVTAAIGFLTQRGTDQLANVTIMCDGQNVHECTTSEQMLELLQSGKAVFAVSVGSLWHQIETALEQEEYVDLEAKPLTIATGRPIDELTAMRMRKKLEAQRLQRATA